MTSLNLKKILKNTSSLVVPTIGATLVIGASIAPAEAMIRSGSTPTSRAGSPTAEKVVSMSPAAQRLMDINSRMASINSAEALTKFMTLKSVYSGNVVEQTGTLADGTHVKTTGFDGVAYVAYTPAQGDKIVAHDAVWEIGGGQAFVAQIDASREAVLELQGKINAPGVNVALVSGASIFVNAQEINVGKLTVAAGKQVESVSGGKLKLLDVNPHAAVMFHAGTSASVRDMGATTLIGGAFGAGEGSYFPVVLHTVAGNKVSVDMVGDGLIEYETQANDESAAALIARSAGDLGVKGIAYASTAEGLAIVHATVNTSGVRLADGEAKYEGGTIILGSGNPAYTQVEGTVNADVVAVKGQISESKAGTTYNVARLYHGGEWFGGNVNADYLASLGDAVSEKAKSLIGSNPGIFLAGENSQLTILKEGVKVNARDVAVLWSDQKTITNAKFTSQGGVIERSSKGWVGSFEENELRATGGLSGDETFANAKLSTGADFVLDDPKHVVFAQESTWGRAGSFGTVSLISTILTAASTITAVNAVGGAGAEFANIAVGDTAAQAAGRFTNGTSGAGVEAVAARAAAVPGATATDVILAVASTIKAVAAVGGAGAEFANIAVGDTAAQAAGRFTNGTSGAGVEAVAARAAAVPGATATDVILAVASTIKAVAAVGGAGAEFANIAVGDTAAQAAGRFTNGTSGAGVEAVAARAAAVPGATATDVILAVASTISAVAVLGGAGAEFANIAVGDTAAQAAGRFTNGTSGAGVEAVAARAAAVPGATATDVILAVASTISAVAVLGGAGAEFANIAVGDTAAQAAGRFTNGTSGAGAVAAAARAGNLTYANYQKRLSANSITAIQDSFMSRAATPADLKSLGFATLAEADAYIASIVKADATTYGIVANAADVNTQLGGDVVLPVADYYSLNYGASQNDAVIMDSASVAGIWGGALNRSMAVRASGDIVVAGDIAKGPNAGSLILQAGRSVLIAGDINASAGNAGYVVIQAGLPKTDGVPYAGGQNVEAGNAFISMKADTTITGAVAGGYIAISLKDAGAAGDITLANIIAPRNAGGVLQGESVFISNRSGGNILQVAGNHSLSLDNNAAATSPFIFHTTGGSVGSTDQAINLVSGAMSAAIRVVANVAGGMYLNAVADAQGMTQGVSLAHANYEGVLKVLLAAGADNKEGWDGTHWRFNSANVLDIGTFFGVAGVNKSQVFGIKATGDVIISKSGGNDFGFADFGAPGSLWGGSIVTDGDVVIRSGQAIVHAAGNVDKSVIKAKNVGLIATTTVGDAAADAYIPLDIKGSVVGHAELGIFKVKGLSSAAEKVLSVGISDPGLLADTFQGVGANFGQKAAPRPAADAAATHAASGYLWSVTTTNGIAAIFASDDHKVVLNKAKDGTVASVVTTAVNNHIAIQAGSIENADTAGYLHVIDASTISLNATKGSVGSLGSPIQVSGGNALSSVVAKSATAGGVAADNTASIFLKAKTNMVLGHADVAGAVNLAAVDNITTVGKGNIFIDGLADDAQHKILTMANGIDAISARDGTVFIQAGAIGGTNANGVTGSKISLLAQQAKTDKDNTAKIDIAVTGANGYVGGNYGAADNKMIQVEARTVNADGATTATTAAQRGNITLKFNAAGDRTRFNVLGIESDSLAKAIVADTTMKAGILAGNDAIVALTVGDTGKLVLGSTGATATETVIKAASGEISFIVGAGAASSVTVATANSLIESAVLRLAGHNNSTIGETGVFTAGDSATNKRLWWKPTGDLGILVGAFGDAYIQTWGDVALGSADASAGRADAAESKINYGLTFSDGNTENNTVHAGYVIGDGKGLYLSAADADSKAVQKVFISHTMNNALQIGNANPASAVLEGSFVGYKQVDGYALAGVDVDAANDAVAGRIQFQDASKLVVIAPKVGGFDKPTTRLKVGAAGNYSGYIFGSADNAHFLVSNADNAVSKIKIGAPAGGIVIADWTAGRDKDVKSLRNFVMNGDDSVFSVKSARVNRGVVGFAGDGAVVDGKSTYALSSKGSVAIETVGALEGSANTTISAKNVMFKAASIGNAAAILVDLAQGGRITLDSGAGVANVTAPTSDLMFGVKGLTAEKDSIGGIFVDGFKGAGAKTLVATKGAVSFAEGFKSDGAGLVTVDAFAGDNGKVNFLGDATFAGGLTTHAKTATDLTSVISVGGNTSITADKGDLTTSGKGAVKFTAGANLTLIATDGAIGGKDAHFAVDTGNNNITGLVVESKTGTYAKFAGTGDITTLAGTANVIKVTKGDTDLLIGGNFTLFNHAGAVNMVEGNLSVVSSSEAAVFTLNGAAAVTLARGHMNFVAHSYRTGNARLDAYEGITFGFIGANAADDLSLTAAGIGAHVKKVVIGAKDADVAFTAAADMNFANAAALKDISISGKSIAGARALQAIAGATVKLDIAGEVAANFEAAGAGLTVSGNVGRLVSVLAGTKTTFTSFKITGEDATVQSTLSANTTTMLGIGKDVDFGLNFQLTQTNDTAFTNTKETRFKVGKLDVVGAKGTFFTAANEMHVALTAAAVADGSLTVNNESDKLAIDAAWGLTSEDNGGADRTVSLTQSGELAFDKAGSLVRSVAANNDKLVHVVLNAGKVTSADTWTAGTHVNLSDAGAPGSGSGTLTFAGSTEDGVVLKTNVGHFKANGAEMLSLDNQDNALVVDQSGAGKKNGFVKLETGAGALTVGGLQSDFKTLIFSSDVVAPSTYLNTNFVRVDTLGLLTKQVALRQIDGKDRVAFIDMTPEDATLKTAADALAVLKTTMDTTAATAAAAGATPAQKATATAAKTAYDTSVAVGGVYHTAKGVFEANLHDLSAFKSIILGGSDALTVASGTYGASYDSVDLRGLVKVDDASKFASKTFAVANTGSDALNLTLHNVSTFGDSSSNGAITIVATGDEKTRLAKIGSVKTQGALSIKTDADDLSAVANSKITSKGDITLDAAKTIGAHGAIDFAGELVLKTATKATVHAQDGATIKSLDKVVDLTASGDAGLLSGVTTGLTSFTYDAVAADMDVSKLTSVAGAKTVALRNIEKATGAFAAESATDVTISANNHLLTGLKTAKNGKVVLDGRVSTASDHAFAHSIKVDGYDAGNLSIYVSGKEETTLNAVKTPTGTPFLDFVKLEKEDGEVTPTGFAVDKDVKVGSTDLGDSFDMFFNAKSFKEGDKDITDVDALEALHNAQTTFEKAADVKAYFDKAAESLPEADRTLVNAAKLVQKTSKETAVVTSLLSRVKAEGRFVRDWNQSKDFFGSKIKVNPLLMQTAR